jgi:hypothetical protein
VPPPCLLASPPPKLATTELRWPPLHLLVPSECPLDDWSGRRPSSRELHGRSWWLIHHGPHPILVHGSWTKSTTFLFTKTITEFPGKPCHITDNPLSSTEIPIKSLVLNETSFQLPFYIQTPDLCPNYNYTPVFLHIRPPNILYSQIYPFKLCIIPNLPSELLSFISFQP